MISVKNLKVFKEKIVPLILTGTITLSLSSCGTVNMSETSTRDLISIEEVANITELDELLNNDKLKINDSNIVDEADKLERYMNTVDKLSEIDFDGVDELRPLTEEETKTLPELSEEDIDKLIESASSKEKDLKSLEEKIIALKKLNYLRKYCNEWVIQNGKKISIEFMMAAVKASVACELNISPDEYSKITLPCLYSSSPDEIPDYIVNYGEQKYRVSSGSSEIWNTIGYIYTVQSADRINDETRFPTFRKALNYGKTTIAAGCDLKGEYLIEQNDSNYINKNFMPKK